jgi:hypothetical protein
MITETNLIWLQQELRAAALGGAADETVFNLIDAINLIKEGL